MLKSSGSKKNDLNQWIYNEWHEYDTTEHWKLNRPSSDVENFI